MSDADLDRTPLYRQLAKKLTAEIAKGEKGAYPPGSKLPSETELIERYRVSRGTVRSAVLALRQDGLVVVRHGQGTTVRPPTTATPVIPRTVTRTSRGLLTGWTDAEPPSVTRAYLADDRAALLHRNPSDEDAVFVTDRLVVHTATEARAALQVVLPFDVILDTAIEQEPEAHPETMYAALIEAGHTLHWQETVTARAPTPDDRATFGDDGWLLVTHRVTWTKDRPLILETLRLPAGAAQLGYRITPNRPSDGWHG